MPYGDIGVNHEQGTASGSWSWINSNWTRRCEVVTLSQITANWSILCVSIEHTMSRRYRHSEVVSDF